MGTGHSGNSENIDVQPLRTCIMHFFQVYGVKNAPKFLLQKWTPNDLKIIKNNKMHSPGSYSPLPPREPQSTPTQNCEININHEQRTPGWIFKMFTVVSIFIRFSKLDHQNFSKAI